MEDLERSVSRRASRHLSAARPAWLDDPDVVLMKRVRGGDVESFSTLFRKHSAAVVQYAYRFVHSRSRAEELAQTVFLHLYKARDRYEPRARFLTYLYRITTNVCLNELRRREHGTMIDSLDVPIDGAAESAPSVLQIADHKVQDPATQLSGKELERAVRRVLERLPAQQRAAFLLGRLDGMSYREVARVLGTSVSAVKSLVFRATRTIRSELNDEDGAARRSSRQGADLYDSAEDASMIQLHG